MATAVTAKVEHDYHGMGSIPQYAVKIDGCVGLTTTGLANTVINPFNEDMVVMSVYMVVTTVDDTGSADLEIGLADDTSAATNGKEFFDNITTYSTTGVYEGLATQAITGGARPVWTVAGTATDSYVTVYQTGAVDASSLVFNLILIVAPYAKFKAT